MWCLYGCLMALGESSPWDRKQGCYWLGKYGSGSETWGVRREWIELDVAVMILIRENVIREKLRNPSGGRASSATKQRNRESTHPSFTNEYIDTDCYCAWPQVQTHQKDRCQFGGVETARPCHRRKIAQANASREAQGPAGGLG